MATGRNTTTGPVVSRFHTYPRCAIVFLHLRHGTTRGNWLAAAPRSRLHRPSALVVSLAKRTLRLRARLAMADDNPDTREATLRSVRRRLFTEDVDDKSTTPNKDEIEKQFMEEEAQLLAEKKAKWNFDFKEERPLDGQWQWERIGKSSDKQRTNGGASARDAPENADANTQRTSGDARKQAP